MPILVVNTSHFGVLNAKIVLWNLLKVKRHILAFKMPAFSVYEMDPRKSVTKFDWQSVQRLFHFRYEECSLFDDWYKCQRDLSIPGKHYIPIGSFCIYADFAFEESVGHNFSRMDRLLWKRKQNSKLTDLVEKKIEFGK